MHRIPALLLLFIAAAFASNIGGFAEPGEVPSTVKEFTTVVREKYAYDGADGALTYIRENELALDSADGACVSGMYWLIRATMEIELDQETQAQDSLYKGIARAREAKNCAVVLPFMAGALFQGTWFPGCATLLTEYEKDNVLGYQNETLLCAALIFAASEDLVPDRIASRRERRYAVSSQLEELGSLAAKLVSLFDPIEGAPATESSEWQFTEPSPAFAVDQAEFSQFLDQIQKAAAECEAGVLSESTTDVFSVVRVIVISALLSDRPVEDEALVKLVSDALAGHHKPLDEYARTWWAFGDLAGEMTAPASAGEIENWPVDVLLNEATVLAASDDGPEALHLVAAAELKDPTNPELYSTKAYCLMRADGPDAMEQYIEETRKHWEGTSAEVSITHYLNYLAKDDGKEN